MKKPSDNILAVLAGLMISAVSLVIVWLVAVVFCSLAEGWS